MDIFAFFKPHVENSVSTPLFFMPPLLTCICAFEPAARIHRAAASGRPLLYRRRVLGRLPHGQAAAEREETRAATVLRAAVIAG